MKTISRLLMLAALATAFALQAFGQDAAASPANVCDEQAKNDLYTQYYNLKKTDQAKAFDISKQYLDKYGSCTDNYTASVKKFHDAYEKAVGGIQLRSDFFDAFNKNDVAKLNSLAQQLLAKDANDAAVASLAAIGNYQNIGKNPAATDATAFDYANKALAIINAGQEPKDLGGKVSWAPFTSKDDAVAKLNFAIAGLELKPNTERTNVEDASKRLVELAQGSSSVKELPDLYSYLGFTYEKEAEPMLAKYKDITKNYTVETEESKLLLLNINQVIDRTIDAYARAAAYSTNPADKAKYMAKLTDLYKSRHNNDVSGLDAYIAGIKGQPLLITQPITQLPAAAPAATPGADGTGDGASTTSTPAASPVAAPAAGTTAKPAPTTTAKPATTTPAKPATPTTNKKPPVSRHH